MVRCTDHIDMTIAAVDWDIKPQTKPNKFMDTEEKDYPGLQTLA